MVLADKIDCSDGWDQQTKRLTLSHTAFGMRVIFAARGARQPKTSLAAIDQQGPNIETTSGYDSGRHWVAREAELPNPPPHEASKLMEEQNPLAGAANRRVVELEQELTALREELSRRDNHIVSLQSSLDLTMNENERLTIQLAESEAALAKLGPLQEQSSAPAAESGAGQDPAAAPTNPPSVASRMVENQEVANDTCAQLEKITAELAAAKAECNTLIAACNETDELRKLETNAFISQLDAMFSRATDAERQLAAARQELQVRTEKNRAILRANSELSVRLSESDAACARTHFQVEAAKTALIAAVAKCDRLTAALEDGHERRLTDFRTLTGELETMSLRAIAAESALFEARRSLARKFEQLQERLNAEACRNQQLGLSRAKLIERICVLLQLIDIRRRKAGESGEPAGQAGVHRPESPGGIAARIQLISSTELLMSTVTI